MLQKFSLKLRIVLPLLAMMLGIFIVSGFLVGQYYARMTAAKGMTQSVGVIRAVSNIIHEVQKERAASVLFLNKIYSKDELDAQRQLGNQQLGILESLAGEIPTPVILEAIATHTKRYQEIRRIVDEQKAPAAEVARMIGILVDSWISVQVACAQAHHLEGMEASLLSIAIFEKSKESMGRLRAQLNVVLSANQPVSSATVSLLATHRAGVLSNMDSPGLSISQKSRDSIDRILKTDDWLTVLKVYDKVIEQSEVGQYGFDSKNFSATITRVIDDVRQVIRPEIELTAARITAAANEALRNFVLCISVILLLILVSIGSSFHVVLSVNRSLDHIARLLQQGAGAVLKTAEQIADASRKLASSATQQAAALQETSAAIEETTAMIKKNADNSRTSADLSQYSHGSALKGKSIVEEMTSSITDIARSNDNILQQTEVSNKELAEIVRVIQEIEGKTRVINDIVFQTRLLSFNASVEAARAGEQGKGFAVVAEEIGNLAQMSGSSAKEIHELLGGSIKLVESIVNQSSTQVGQLVLKGKTKIDAGVVTAERCGSILQEILDNASRVGTMTNAISQACGEQSNGISEISRAMSELDDVAQQNSAACEQTSTSADELKGHAAQMQSMVLELNKVVHGHQKAA